MVTCALNELFDVEYGNSLELVALRKDNEGINFVARTQKNNGVVAKVKKTITENAFSKGLITVAVSGSVMESFLQPEDFITGYHIMVLTPKKKMSDEVKLFYCHCLRMNKFKYSYGRQANITLPELEVPVLLEAENFVKTFSISDMEKDIIDKLDLTWLNEETPQKETKPCLVSLSELFEMKNGVASTEIKRLPYKKNANWIPYIRPSYKQSTSIDAYVNKNTVMQNKIFPKETLYVSTNGQGSHTYSYVSVEDFVPNSDVTVLMPKNPMTLKEKLFYAMCISHNRFKFSYGRKPKGNRLEKILVPSMMDARFDKMEISNLNIMQ